MCQSLCRGRGGICCSRSLCPWSCSPLPCPFSKSLERPFCFPVCLLELCVGCTCSQHKYFAHELSLLLFLLSVKDIFFSSLFSCDWWWNTVPCLWKHQQRGLAGHSIMPKLLFTTLSFTQMELMLLLREQASAQKEEELSCTHACTHLFNHLFCFLGSYLHTDKYC